MKNEGQEQIYVVVIEELIKQLVKTRAELAEAIEEIENLTQGIEYGVHKFLYHALNVNEELEGHLKGLIE